jgi:hypothetical protein
MPRDSATAAKWHHLQAAPVYVLLAAVPLALLQLLDWI